MPLRLAVVGTLCGSVIAGSVAAGLGLGSAGTGNTEAPIEERATFATRAAHIDAALTNGRGGVAAFDRASVSGALPEPPMPEAMPAPIASATPDPAQDAGDAIAVEVAMESVSAALPEPGPAAMPAPIASATPDPAQDAGEAMAVEVAMASVSGALPEPGPAAMPAPIASATPDPAQDAGAAMAVEVAMASVSGALPEPHPAAMPAPIASATPDPAQDAGEAMALEAASMESVAALPEPGAAATPGVQLAALFTSDPVEDLKPGRPVETPNECLVAEICIDEYLWSLYEATPKVDTNKVRQRIKTSVRKKGKTRTVIKTITKYVVADFTWKDPVAAQRVGMSLKDYVIGGMDRGFKLKLYHALRAMDAAGLMPGITSAFRDDYRQSIASGNKAASDSSYHGGSRRGGYANGLAADLVSLKGETRLQRYASSRELWKWIDAHENELGIGRPYLDRDPPHVGPIDGKEYADKRGRAKAKLAGSATNRRDPVAAGDNRGTTERAAKVGSLKVGSI